MLFKLASNLSEYDKSLIGKIALATSTPPGMKKPLSFRNESGP
jgi:hypothetical protein